jgi:hypothetical protein
MPLPKFDSPTDIFLPNPIFGFPFGFLGLKIIISSNKIHSKINIFHTLALKIEKQTLLNLTRRELSMNTCPQIPIQFSVLILFSFH